MLKTHSYLTSTTAAAKKNVHFHTTNMRLWNEKTFIMFMFCIIRWNGEMNCKGLTSSSKPIFFHSCYSTSYIQSNANVAFSWTIVDVCSTVSTNIVSSMNIIRFGSHSLFLGFFASFVFRCCYNFLISAISKFIHKYNTMQAFFCSLFHSSSQNMLLLSLLYLLLFLSSLSSSIFLLVFRVICFLYCFSYTHNFCLIVFHTMWILFHNNVIAKNHSTKTASTERINARCNQWKMKFRDFYWPIMVSLAFLRFFIFFPFFLRHFSAVARCNGIQPLFWYVLSSVAGAALLLIK